MRSMDWASLVPVALGGLLAAGGGWAGQWWGAREARAKEHRDREQERYVWAREQRYKTHVQFLQAFDQLRNALARFQGKQSGATRPTDNEFWTLGSYLTMLELVTEPATFHKADKAYWALLDYAYEKTDALDVQLQLRKYVSEVRAESNLGPLELTTRPVEEPP